MTIRRRDPARDGAELPASHVVISLDDPADLGSQDVGQLIESVWVQVGLVAPVQRDAPHREPRDAGPRLLRATAVDRVTGEALSGVAGLGLRPQLLEAAVDALRRCGLEIEDPERLLPRGPSGARDARA
jgi:hypothetical protein